MSKTKHFVGSKYPKELPDWWPEIGYWWVMYWRGVALPRLVLIHPNHPPVTWVKNNVGEWADMKEITL